MSRQARAVAIKKHKAYHRKFAAAASSHGTSTFSVRVTVTNDGGSNTKTRTNYISGTY